MIVFIHHSVNPYRVALFNKLAETKIPFNVYFLSSPARNRRWKISDYKMNFSFKFLTGFKFYFPGNDHWYFQITSGLWNKLKQDKPDAIIVFGWNYLATYTSFLYAKINRVKFVIWSGSTKYENSTIRNVSLPFVRLLVRFSDYLIAYGTRAKQYLISLGVNPKKILVAYNSVYNEKFIRDCKKYKNNNYVRDKYRIPKSEKIVLFVGQYLKRKGIFALLNVARKLKRDKNIVFLLVGYGPEEHSIKSYAEKYNLLNVIVAGYVKNEILGRYYSACDLFVLPSFEEVWGLVLNEAMCAGKSVLVSKYAGSSADLVKEGCNGFTIDPSDPDDIANKVNTILTNDDKRRLFGENSLKIIRNINYGQNIKQVEQIYKNLYFNSHT